MDVMNQMAAGVASPGFSKPRGCHGIAALNVIMTCAMLAMYSAQVWSFDNDHKVINYVDR